MNTLEPFPEENQEVPPPAPSFWRSLGQAVGRGLAKIGITFFRNLKNKGVGVLLICAIAAALSGASCPQAQEFGAGVVEGASGCLADVEGCVPTPRPTPTPRATPLSGEK